MPGGDVGLSPLPWLSQSKAGWGATVRDAACTVDTEDGVAYVHGGTLPSQSNAVSCTLFKVPLASSSHAAALYTEADAMQSTTQMSEDPLDASECQGPARYGHVALQHGGYLVVHGGKDPHGIVQSDVHGFHLDRRRWILLKHVLGGCAPPRMCGHSVTPLGAAHPGVFLVVGLEQGAEYRSRFAPRKRSRSVHGRDHTVGGAAPLSVFRLDLAAFQRGWSRIAACNAATLPRLEHISVFSYARSDAAADVDVHADADIAAAATTADLFVLGEAGVDGSASGKAPASCHAQLWRLRLTSGVWQQVHFCVSGSPLQDHCALSSGTRATSHSFNPPITLMVLRDVPAIISCANTTNESDQAAERPVRLVFAARAWETGPIHGTRALCVAELCPSRIRRIDESNTLAVELERSSALMLKWKSSIVLLSQSTDVSSDGNHHQAGQQRLYLVDGSGNLSHVNVA